MTTPENSIDHQEKRIDDMDRPMIGVIRMHMTDFDAQPEVVPPADEHKSSLIQPDALVLSSGRVIPKRYSRSTLSVEPTDDMSSTDPILDKRSHPNGRSKRFVRNSAVLVLGATLAAACASFLSENDTQDTLLPLPTTTVDSTTIPAETTTTSQAVIVECEVNSQGQVVVESGQNMSQIAAACGRSLGELMEWNALTNANDIDAGQILVVTPPTTTTTSPAITIPIETVPPETMPQETAPPTTQMPLETFLSAKECADLGGTLVPVPNDGRGTWKFFKELGLTEYQVGTIYNSDIPAKFHLLQITAGEKPIECKPDASVIHAAAPLATPPTTTSVTG